ncbi:hypothetical protein [Parasphingorhabdus sp.]|uniref:hypothetical protein n=1 Tax=Parasphingorhabdus sp. TaxID=2709688 RepID=UPI003264E1BF
MIAVTGLLLMVGAQTVQAQSTQPEPLEPVIADLPSVSEYSLPPGDNSTVTDNPAQGPVEENALPPETIEPSAGPAPDSPVPNTPAPTATRPADEGASPGFDTILTVPADPEPAANSLPDTTTAGPAARTAAPPEFRQPAQQPMPATGPAPGFSFESDQPTESPNSNLTETTPVAPDGSFPWYLYLALGVAGIAVATAMMWRRKRAMTQAAIEQDESFEPRIALEPVEVDTVGSSTETPTTSPEPATTEPSPPAEGFVHSNAGGNRRNSDLGVQNFGSARPQRWGHVRIEFTANAASSTLINAVLNYTVTLSNESGDRLTNLKLSGAMAQAEKDLAMSDLGFSEDVLHEIAVLDGNETITLTGELRLPLNAIRPIAFKSQALFIPLTRFAVEYQDNDDERHRQVAAFVVGREYDPPRPRMAPFRLDLGPRSFAPIGQRALHT